MMGTLNALTASASAPSSKGAVGSSAPLDRSDKPEPAKDFAQVLRDEGQPAQDKAGSAAATEPNEPTDVPEPAPPSPDVSGTEPAKEPQQEPQWPPAGLTGLFAGLFPAQSTIAAPATSGLALDADPGSGLDAIAAPLSNVSATAVGAMVLAGAAAATATAASTSSTAANPSTATLASAATTAMATNAAPAAGAAIAGAVDSNANAGTTPPGALAASAPATPALPAVALNAAQVVVPLDASNLANALPKEWIDSLRRDTEADTTAPIGNPPSTSPAAGANLGLARVAVVNPMAAPSPDLYGENFDDAFGSRLTWMAEQKIGHAQIRINPQDLGPVEIRMRLDGERVHADFSSPQAEVRQALEHSLPRLREMLAQHGFQLAQADVGQHGDPRSPASGKGDRDADSNGGGDSLAQTSSITGSQRISRGLLDAYA